MRGEPEIPGACSLPRDGCRKSPFVDSLRRAAGRSPARLGRFFGSSHSIVGAVRKWKTWFWVFHFSIRPRRRRCGNVGISPGGGEISKGLVERVGSLTLAFHAFHSPGISIALSHRGLRQRAKRLSLAFCIRRAASVSLLAAACRCSMAGVIPSFRDFSHSGSDVSFS